MTAFADSSALVKLYADEEDADLVRRHDVLVISQLARVEVPSAIWRKHRLGELSAEAADVLARSFAADFAGGDARSFLVVAVTPAVLDDAARLVSRHPLRAFDAVQLASACAAHRAAADGLPFLCFDHRVRDAAAAEGLALA
ncbi:MAG: type II toxin-antitoxin system VapC family toxin [Microbacterium sp.]